MEIQSIYQHAIKFAAARHAERNQTIPGTNLPYVMHLSNVAMEILIAWQSKPDFNLELTLKLALLHDTLEDTSATMDEISKEFGHETAQGVAALTKNDRLPQSEKMTDSLNRIKAQPKEAAIVKLADRITNLQKRPEHWDTPKKQAYQQEALQVLQRLKGANSYPEQQLKKKIEDYGKHI